MQGQSDFSGNIEPAPHPPTIAERIAKQQRKKQRVLDYFEQREGATRLALARKIAHDLLLVSPRSITVADVHDEFVKRYGEEAWRDENGRSYWAGGVFREKGWQAVDVARSPLNHNDSNRVWRWIGGAK